MSGSRNPDTIKAEIDAEIEGLQESLVTYWDAKFNEVVDSQLLRKAGFISKLDEQISYTKKIISLVEEFKRTPQFNQYEDAEYYTRLSNLNGLIVECENAKKMFGALERAPYKDVNQTNWKNAKKKLIESQEQHENNLYVKTIIQDVSNKDYEILGLQKGAATDDIKKAYRKLAVTEHPDKHGNSKEATDKFANIKAAYERIISKQATPVAAAAAAPAPGAPVNTTAAAAKKPDTAEPHDTDRPQTQFAKNIQAKIAAIKEKAAKPKSAAVSKPASTPAAKPKATAAKPATAKPIAKSLAEQLKQKIDERKDSTDAIKALESRLEARTAAAPIPPKSSGTRSKEIDRLNQTLKKEDEAERRKHVETISQEAVAKKSEAQQPSTGKTADENYQLKQNLMLEIDKLSKASKAYSESKKNLPAGETSTLVRINRGIADARFQLVDAHIADNESKTSFYRPKPILADMSISGITAQIKMVEDLKNQFEKEKTRLDELIKQDAAQKAKEKADKASVEAENDKLVSTPGNKSIDNIANEIREKIEILGIKLSDAEEKSRHYEGEKIGIRNQVLAIRNGTYEPITTASGFVDRLTQINYLILTATQIRKKDLDEFNGLNRTLDGYIKDTEAVLKLIESQTLQVSSHETPSAEIQQNEDKLKAPISAPADSNISDNNTSIQGRPTYDEQSIDDNVDDNEEPIIPGQPVANMGGVNTPQGVIIGAKPGAVSKPYKKPIPTPPTVKIASTNLQATREATKLPDFKVPPVANKGAPANIKTTLSPNAKSNAKPSLGTTKQPPFKYRPPFPSGATRVTSEAVVKKNEIQFERENAKGDGNCAFNAFVLGMCTRETLDSIAQRFGQDGKNINIGLKQFIDQAANKLEVPASWGAITKKMLELRESNKEDLQVELASILRPLAIQLIEQHKSQIGDSLLNNIISVVLYNTNDDIFRRLPAISDAINNIKSAKISDSEKEKQITEFWNNSGFDLFLGEMRVNAQFAGDIELAQLANYFKLNLYVEAPRFNNQSVLLNQGMNGEVLKTSAGFKLNKTLLDELIKVGIISGDNAPEETRKYFFEPMTRDEFNSKLGETQFGDSDKVSIGTLWDKQYIPAPQIKLFNQSADHWENWKPTSQTPVKIIDVQEQKNDLPASPVAATPMAKGKKLPPIPQKPAASAAAAPSQPEKKDDTPHSITYQSTKHPARMQYDRLVAEASAAKPTPIAEPRASLGSTSTDYTRTIAELDDILNDLNTANKTDESVSANSARHENTDDNIDVLLRQLVDSNLPPKVANQPSDDELENLLNLLKQQTEAEPDGNKTRPSTSEFDPASLDDLIKHKSANKSPELAKQPKPIFHATEMVASELDRKIKSIIAELNDNIKMLERCNTNNTWDNILIDLKTARDYLDKDHVAIESKEKYIAEQLPLVLNKIKAASPTLEIFTIPDELNKLATIERLLQEREKLVRKASTLSEVEAITKVSNEQINTFLKMRTIEARSPEERMRKARIAKPTIQAERQINEADKAKEAANAVVGICENLDHLHNLLHRKHNTLKSSLESLDTELNKLYKKSQHTRSLDDDLRLAQIVKELASNHIAASGNYEKVQEILKTASAHIKERIGADRDSFLGILDINKESEDTKAKARSYLNHYDDINHQLTEIELQIANHQQQAKSVSIPDIRVTNDEQVTATYSAIPELDDLITEMNASAKAASGASHDADTNEIKQFQEKIILHIDLLDQIIQSDSTKNRQWQPYLSQLSEIKRYLANSESSTANKLSFIQARLGMLQKIATEISPTMAITPNAEEHAKIQKALMALQDIKETIRTESDYEKIKTAGEANKSLLKEQLGITSADRKNDKTGADSLVAKKDAQQTASACYLELESFCHALRQQAAAINQDIAADIPEPSTINRPHIIKLSEIESILRVRSNNIDNKDSPIKKGAEKLIQYLGEIISSIGKIDLLGDSAEKSNLLLQLSYQVDSAMRLTDEPAMHSILENINDNDQMKNIFKVIKDTYSPKEDINKQMKLHEDKFKSLIELIKPLQEYLITQPTEGDSHKIANNLLRSIVAIHTDMYEKSTPKLLESLQNQIENVRKLYGDLIKSDASLNSFITTIDSNCDNLLKTRLYEVNQLLKGELTAPSPANLKPSTTTKTSKSLFEEVFRNPVLGLTKISEILPVALDGKLVKDGYLDMDIRAKIFDCRASDYDYQGECNGRPVLIKVNTDKLNPIHPEEARIQALRYMRGMLLIISNSGLADTAQDELKKQMLAAYNHFDKFDAKTTHQFIDALSGLLQDNYNITLDAARSDLSKAKNMSELLEEHPDIVTCSSENGKISIETASLLKIDDKFYNENFNHLSNQPWFQAANKKFAIPGWAQIAFNSNAERIRQLGVPSASSSRWLPQPSNAQTIETYVVSTDKPDVIISSSRWCRLGTIGLSSINEKSSPKEKEALAERQAREVVDQILPDGVEHLNTLYEPLKINLGDLPMYVSYQTLMTPHDVEGLLSTHDTNNNAKFVNLTTQIFNSYRDKAAASGFIFSHTNAAINKMTLSPTAKNSLKAHVEARDRKILATESLMKLIVVGDYAQPDKFDSPKQYYADNVRDALAKKSDITPELSNEIYRRAYALACLKDLLANKPPYNKLPVYQRNLMMAALEFHMMGSQAVTIAGCKSARDRTAIFSAAVKTMQENPESMHDWAVLNKGIIQSLEQGHHFRAMSFHCAIAKIDKVYPSYFNALSKETQKGIKANSQFTNKHHGKGQPLTATIARSAADMMTYARDKLKRSQSTTANPVKPQRTDAVDKQAERTIKELYKEAAATSAKPFGPNAAGTPPKSSDEIVNAAKEKLSKLTPDAIKKQKDKSLAPKPLVKKEGEPLPVKPATEKAAVEASSSEMAAPEIPPADNAADLAKQTAKELSDLVGELDKEAAATPEKPIKPLADNSPDTTLNLPKKAASSAPAGTKTTLSDDEKKEIIKNIRSNNTIDRYQNMAKYYAVAAQRAANSVTGEAELNKIQELCRKMMDQITAYQEHLDQEMPKNENHQEIVSDIQKNLDKALAQKKQTNVAHFSHTSHVAEYNQSTPDIQILREQLPIFSTTTPSTTGTIETSISPAINTTDAINNKVRVNQTTINTKGFLGQKSSTDVASVQRMQGGTFVSNFYVKDPKAIKKFDADNYLQWAVIEVENFRAANPNPDEPMIIKGNMPPKLVKEIATYCAAKNYDYKITVTNLTDFNPKPTDIAALEKRLEKNKAIVYGHAEILATQRKEVEDFEKNVRKAPPPLGGGTTH